MERDFVHHLRAGMGCPHDLIASQKADRRFAIYRNNVIHSLTTALATRYPATQRLLGGECFTACAQLYVETEKPTSPILMFYGNGFPDFLATIPSLVDWPFLADVARIEQARTEAYHAADHAPLRLAVGDAQDIETYLGRMIKAHPAARVLHSPYPAGTIWAASDSPEALSIESWRDETIAITRGRYEVQVSLVPRGTAACFEEIGKGAVLGDAITTACNRHRDCDAASILAALLRCDLLAAPQ